MLWGFKALLHLFAVTLYLIFFTSPWALGCALFTGIIGLALAKVYGPVMSRRGLTLIMMISVLVGWGGGLAMEEWVWVSDLLGPSLSLRVSECVFFSGLSFGVLFCLRTAGARSASGALVEGAFVLFSTVQLFAAHRGGHINEPRFFIDYLYITGHPQVSWWFEAFGVGVALVAMLMMARVRRMFHFIFALMLIFGGFHLIRSLLSTDRLHKVVEPITFGGSGQGEGSESEKSGKGGQGDGQQNQNRPDQRPPTPVAVAIFHDDYTPENYILYFRQQALSMFDGVKLVAAPGGAFDRDVITGFPHDTSLKAEPLQAEEAHVKVSTSMFLIEEHSTPPTLTHGVEVAPMTNPDSQRFAAAYEVTSFVPSVPLSRHIGRSSIPDAWSPEQRRHYLATHDEDPRYKTLSAEITRELPSYLSADPIRKAIAIKRYLEREGYYTLKVKHRSSKDPTASFLFGDLKGYCVHFAHSAVHLLRSQGVAARVALGYAVDSRTRSNSSAVVITGDRAHAWPEIHIDGVGWVTFDIYPEHSDSPPSQTVSQSLESLFGEIARNQLQRGLPEATELPWVDLTIWSLMSLLAVLILGYTVTAWRIIRVIIGSAEYRGRVAYLLALDRLSYAGPRRYFGESRERYAARLKTRAPGFDELTQAHLRWALGAPQHRSAYGAEVHALSAEVIRAFARRHKTRWLLSCLNPFCWWRSR